MQEILARFLIGGVVVSAFAILGDLFRPRTFAGLFGAAPSVALATLALTVASNGPRYAGIEARSMALGAVALGLYSAAVTRILMRHRTPVKRATLLTMGVWFAAAFGLWFALLRRA